MKCFFKIASMLLLATVILSFVGCKHPTGGGNQSGNQNGGGTTPAAFNARETPLTLEATQDGNITFTNKRASLQYKKNGGELTNVPGNLIFYNAGDKIELFANEEDVSTDGSRFRIDCSSDCYIYGNIMSLLDPTNYKTKTEITANYAFAGLFVANSHIKNHGEKELVLPATTLTEGCYLQMFYSCNGLTRAPALPATTLAKNCYNSMFYYCTSLTSAPALPATTLAESCYHSMFNYCSGLTSAPALPATTLEKNCYYNMFSSCSGLTSAPVISATTLAESCCKQMFYRCSGLTSAPALPATTLAESCYEYMFEECTSLQSSPVLSAPVLVKKCYYGMFWGCSRLNSITCLATDTSAEDCTAIWAYSIASSGTFTKAASMTNWTNGINGIRNGWTVENYSAQ